MFQLQKKDFHKIENLVQIKNKIFEIQICQFDSHQNYRFSEEQMLILSPDAYIFISETKQPFKIELKESENFDSFIYFFHKLISLFSTRERIKISFMNSFRYQEIGNKLKIQSLLNAVQSFNKTRQIQEYFFKTNDFDSISQLIKKDLKVKLKENILEVNSIFSCLISNKMFRYTQSNMTDVVDFSDFNFPIHITNILQIQRGVTF